MASASMYLLQFKQRLECCAQYTLSPEVTAERLQPLMAYFAPEE